MRVRAGKRVLTDDLEKLSKITWKNCKFKNLNSIDTLFNKSLKIWNHYFDKEKYLQLLSAYVSGNMYSTTIQKCFVFERRSYQNWRMCKGRISVSFRAPGRIVVLQYLNFSSNYWVAEFIELCHLKFELFLPNARNSLIQSRKLMVTHRHSQLKLLSQLTGGGC